MTQSFPDLDRPKMPDSILEIGAPDTFLPSPEMAEWVRACYLDEDGPLYSPDHQHLRDAKIGYLLSNVANSRKRRRICGTAELVESIGVGSGVWRRSRQIAAIRGMFGEVPDFLITFDAFALNDYDDASFCALVDHELCHCGQAVDEFGAPKFSRDTGLPVFAMRGHDVEEFVSVVRRFGIGAAGSDAVDLVIAAAARPTIGPAVLREACGTCLRLAA